MFVRCEFIINPTVGVVQPESPWVTVGSEYLVVGIHVDAGRPVVLRIVDDSGEPSLWPMSMFTVIDGRLPLEWEAHGQAGALEIEPREFEPPGFWERYWERGQEERRRFADFVTNNRDR